jgi:hypothetical protein
MGKLAQAASKSNTVVTTIDEKRMEDPLGI